MVNQNLLSLARSLHSLKAQRPQRKPFKQNLFLVLNPNHDFAYLSAFAFSARGRF